MILVSARGDHKLHAAKGTYRDDVGIALSTRTPMVVQMKNQKGASVILSLSALLQFSFKLTNRLSKLSKMPTEMWPSERLSSGVSV